MRHPPSYPPMVRAGKLWRRRYNDGVRRTTIVAPEELLDRLQTIAHERGVSMACLIREAMEEKARSHWPKPKSIGIGDSGRTDVSQLASDWRQFEPRSWR